MFPFRVHRDAPGKPTSGRMNAMRSPVPVKILLSAHIGSCGTILTVPGYDRQKMLFPFRHGFTHFSQI